MSQIKIPTNFNIELEFNIAPFHKRLFAWIIDVIVFFVYSFLASTILDIFNFNDNTANGAWLQKIIYLPIFLYPFFCEFTMNGQTIGKRLMHIRVINEFGGNATVSQYILRSLLRLSDVVMLVIILIVALYGATYSYLIAFFFLLILADFLLLILTQKSQRIGDMAAGTLLINTKQINHLNETVFMDVSNSYIPSYPQVMKLSDRDLNTIKNIYNGILKNRDYNLAANTAAKIESVLKIKSIHEEPSEFIKIILKDYNFLSTR